MKLSVLMTGYTPNPAYEGFATNDDYVLAINTGEATKEADYEGVEMGVSIMDTG